MNLDILWGRMLQLVGKTFEFWGDVTGDELRRMRGYQLHCIGQVRVLGGQAADLLRYCTPRQALAVQPAPARSIRSRFSPR